MITFERKQLPNGLIVLLHQDKSTPLVAVNLLFRAGSKYDPPKKSGLAHLFEHLMFSGTKEVPDFDTPIQQSGGENNAYTNSDYANYYSYGPAQNLETLLWLEADRLGNLNISQDALSVQQQVVIEELYETCLNLPYGDVWHHVLPLIYRDHPYEWPVIGRDEREIASIDLDDVLQFYRRHYHVGNAILSVAGNFSFEETWGLVEQYFGKLVGQLTHVKTYKYNLEAYRSTRIMLESKVPLEAFYMIFPMPERNHRAYYLLDLLSDLLSDGRSSLLYQTLVKENQLLTAVDAYITGTLDAGLFILEGRLNNGVEIKAAEAKIWEILERLKQVEIRSPLMEKLKNNTESSIVFSESGTLNKAMNLGFFELIGNADLINQEAQIYGGITENELRDACSEYLTVEKASVIQYVPDSNQ